MPAKLAVIRVGRNMPIDYNKAKWSISVSTKTVLYLY